MHTSWAGAVAGVLALVVGTVGWWWPAASPQVAWSEATVAEDTVVLSPWLPARRELLDPGRGSRTPTPSR